MIAIVIAGRNDHHGGGFMGRLLTTAAFNSKVLMVAGIPHQFCLVEWNSHKQSGAISKLFCERIPNSCAYIVDPMWHNHVCDNPNMPFMEFFAKNVALRRCQHPVALCTNADVLFGTDVLRILGNWQQMKDDTVYRTIGRFDVRVGVEYSSLDQLEPNVTDRRYSDPPAYTNGAGDFQCATMATWRKVTGFDEGIRWAKIHKDARLCHQVLALRGNVLASGACYHLYHADSYIHNPRRGARDAPWGPEWDARHRLPYANPKNWGLTDSRLEEFAPNVQRLMPTIPLREKVPDVALIPKPGEW